MQKTCTIMFTNLLSILCNCDVMVYSVTHRTCRFPWRFSMTLRRSCFSVTLSVTVFPWRSAGAAFRDAFSMTVCPWRFSLTLRRSCFPWRFPWRSAVTAFHYAFPWRRVDHIFRDAFRHGFFFCDSPQAPFSMTLSMTFFRNHPLFRFCGTIVISAYALNRLHSLTTNHSCVLTRWHIRSLLPQSNHLWVCCRRLPQNSYLDVHYIA